MTPPGGRRLALATLTALTATAAGLVPARHARAMRGERPLRIIVPQAAGGAADSMVRLVAEGMAQSTGRSIVVDNRPGGGTVTGTQAVALAAPDGDTIGFVISAHAINQAMRAQMPYDALADFQPVCLGGYSLLALVSSRALPAGTVRELIALAGRSQPPLQYASLGTGSASHLAGELFNLQAGVDLQHVPFNGGGQVYRALAGGDIHLAYMTMDSALPHLKAGRLKLLGATNARRSAGFPQYPTIAETLPGFEVLGFFGFVAPAGTPVLVVNRLYEEISKVLQSAMVSARLAEMASVITLMRPDQFGLFLREEIRKYSALSKRTGITLD